MRLPKLPAPVSQVTTKLAVTQAKSVFSNRLKELAIPQQNRWIAAGLAPLLATCVCFGGLVTFFMSSASWSAPVTLNPQHEVVSAAVSQLDGLQTRRMELQAALASAETTLETARAGPLAVRVAFLQSLRGQTSRLAFRLAASGDGEFANLAQTYSDPQTQLADAETQIAEKTAETDNLSAALATVNGQIEALRATPAVQALDKPVTVMFVPDANTRAYSEGTPLYACKLLAANCHEAGRPGKTLAGSATAEHRLFGKPVAGRYVEIELGSAPDAGRSLLHAGRAPLFF